MKRKSAMQAFLATCAVLGFLAVLGWQTWQDKLDSDIKQTLIAVVFIAFGYYLGSSKGSQDKTDAMTAAPPGPPEAET
ncbi:MAG: hypothetical protein P1P84_02760 [Deferrisomatales bacterium]|nr:hypothetical protein [Deferrisomatales bacterium]